jgi:hypothetical protein
VENCIKDTIDSAENFNHTTCSVPGIYIPNLLAIRAKAQYTCLQITCKYSVVCRVYIYKKRELSLSFISFALELS